MMSGAMNPCLGMVGETALNLAKVFVCCFNSSQPTPQFPERTGMLTLLCKLVALPAYLPVCCSSAPGLYSFQKLSPALLVRWGWKMLSKVNGGYISAPLLEKEEERPLEPTLNFPNRISSGEKPEATFCDGYE